MHQCVRELQVKRAVLHLQWQPMTVFSLLLNRLDESPTCSITSRLFDLCTIHLRIGPWNPSEVRVDIWASTPFMRISRVAWIWVWALGKFQFLTLSLGLVKRACACSSYSCYNISKANANIPRLTPIKSPNWMMHWSSLSKVSSVCTSKPIYMSHSRYFRISFMRA